VRRHGKPWASPDFREAAFSEANPGSGFRERGHPGLKDLSSGFREQAGRPAE
jgi:hypothetical protein